MCNCNKKRKELNAGQVPGTVQSAIAGTGKNIPAQPHINPFNRNRQMAAFNRHTAKR